MNTRDISHLDTADIIAALNGNWSALKKVRGGSGGGTWLRTTEGDVAAQRLAELDAEVADLTALVNAINGVTS